MTKPQIRHRKTVGPKRGSVHAKHCQSSKGSCEMSMAKHYKDLKRIVEKSKKQRQKNFLGDNPRVTVGDIYQTIHAK